MTFCSASKVKVSRTFIYYDYRTELLLCTRRLNVDGSTVNNVSHPCGRAVNAMGSAVLCGPPRQARATICMRKYPVYLAPGTRLRSDGEGFNTYSLCVRACSRRCGCKHGSTQLQQLVPGAHTTHMLKHTFRTREHIAEAQAALDCTRRPTVRLKNIVEFRSKRCYTIATRNK